MERTLETSRLLLHQLTANDTDFILELVNTPDWLKFIGDRDVTTTEDALAYINAIVHNPDIVYWIVRLKNSNIPIGIVTFIKRDYLEHNDVGFAFLPNHMKHGYAHEAVTEVLNEIKKSKNHRNILATTIRDNKNSILLLERLGFSYVDEIEINSEKLLLFAIGEK